MAIELKFKAKKWSTGNSYVVTIPKGVADLLSENEDYQFIIKEGENNGEKKLD